MDKIQVRHGVFYCCEQPIPPNLALECDARLLLFLHGAEGRGWRAGEYARRAISVTPQGPRTHARVRQFLWTPPGGLDTKGPLAPNVIAQVGREAPNWKAWVRKPLPETGEEVLSALFWRVNSRKPDLQQDDLIVYYLSWEDCQEIARLDDDFDYLLEEARGPEIYDHYIASVCEQIKRAVWGKTIVLAYMKRIPALLLSSACPQEPLELKWTGAILFVHPHRK